MLEPGRAAVGRSRDIAGSLPRLLEGAGARWRDAGFGRVFRSNDSDLLTVVKHLPRYWDSARLSREAAHLAFDHARAVLSTTAIGRHCQDFDQDQLNHAAAPARGKTRHGRADAELRAEVATLKGLQGRP